MSFTLKTMLGVAAIEAALLFLLVFSSNSALSSSLERELEKRAETTLRMLLATAQEPILTDDLATLEDLAKQALQIPDVLRVEIRSDDGVLARAEVADRDGDGEDAYSSFIDLNTAGEVRATIEMEFSTASAMSAREELQTQNLLIAASEMLLVALFSFLLGRYLTSNLKQLQQATAAIASGDLGVTVPARGSDELANVSRSFNRMSQELLRSHLERAGSEKRLASVLDGLRDGVCLIGKRGRVRYLNPRATQLLQLLTPEWRPEHVLSHIATWSLEAVRDAQEGRTLIELDTEEQTLFFEASVFEIANDQASEAEQILTIRDVTAERSRDAYDRRQEQLAVVGQLAAGLAHDFNNILGVIIGVAELNLMNEDELDATLRTDFETIHEQAKRSSELIRQILDFSRGGEADAEVLDVGASLKDMVELLRRTIPSTVTLSCDVDGGDVDGALRAPFNETKFQQVIANLVINASAAMPEGGTIHVTARACEGYGLRPNSPTDEHEQWVVVTVADSGQGIPRKLLQRIFEPFFTTKEQSRGSGLGLAQVYGILQRQGGDIHVDSTVGKGTCFSLFLRPEKPTEIQSTTQQIAPEPSITGAMILVVEDQEEMRVTVSAMLTRLGYRFELASSGEQALELYVADPARYDAILTDAVMAGIDGFEVASRLRERGCQLPIVMMSGYFERDRVAFSATEAGIDAFLQKPVGLNELEHALRVRRSRGQEDPGA